METRFLAALSVAQTHNTAALLHKTLLEVRPGGRSVGGVVVGAVRGRLFAIRVQRSADGLDAPHVLGAVAVEPVHVAAHATPAEAVHLVRHAEGVGLLGGGGGRGLNHGGILC